MVDGVLCGGSKGSTGAVVYTDGGLPACGGGCCSRACAPFGPTGVLVCQPASGCHIVGDLCTQDSDCCGSAAIGGAGAGNVTCTFNGDGGLGGLGICRNPVSCKPDGDVCRLASMSCNASCDCCSGNCHQDTCKQDNVGVPRCAPATCAPAGAGCASSASCCNHLPCIPNTNPGDAGSPRFVCGNTTCVPACGGCTNNADCCPGSSCVMQAGNAAGICGPCSTNPPPPPADGGTGSSGGSSGGPSSSGGSGGGSSGAGSSGSSGGPSPDGGGHCSLYGQTCVSSNDCCNGIPCSGGYCVVF
jgi:hypothetical protein